MFREYTLDKFADELSSARPTPGGGGTAALAAALGAALGSMVFNLTLGKKLYNSYADDVKAMVDDTLANLNKAKAEFLLCIDKDAEAFMTLMDYYKLPKNTEEEKQIRSHKLQEGYKIALSAPLELAQKAYDMYDYILSACRYGTKEAISDAGVAVLMLQASIEASVINVKINLSYIKDEKYVLDIKMLCNKLVKEGCSMKDKILDLTYSEIEK